MVDPHWFSWHKASDVNRYSSTVNIFDQMHKVPTDKKWFENFQCDSERVQGKNAFIGESNSKHFVKEIESNNANEMFYEGYNEITSTSLLFRHLLIYSVMHSSILMSQIWKFSIYVIFETH